MAKFELDASNLERLLQVAKDFQGDAEKVINDVLRDYGGQEINDAIMKLLPVSGKRWKGKKPAAKQSKPFTQVNGNLSVTIQTKSNYHYLYFPDDGSTTRKHVGNKQFMLKGAENVEERIIDRCIKNLVDKFEN